MSTELMGGCVMVLCVSIVICMARELIDSWSGYGKMQSVQG
ncbi:hypothetical protein [Pseudoalteromonas sp.]|nr:hypothetical protein [Pseudoalteromonas sp.]